MHVLILLTALSFSGLSDQQTVVLVVGVPGEQKYQAPFKTWSDRWAVAAQKAGANLIRIGQMNETTKSYAADHLEQVLSKQAKESNEPLWLVLIGHGTFDGNEAKFNVKGPDFSAAELAKWLQPFKRPLAVINCASASGPFIHRLSSTGRVVVTATKSGFEQNFARFGDYLSSAISDPSADLDKDEQTSLLEAYLFASARLSEFYEQEARLATEHPLLDDNGDHLGTPAVWFRGVRAKQTAKDGAEVDGLRANQFHLIRSQRENLMPPEVRMRRDQLERKVAELRRQKADMTKDDYYGKLQIVLIELAELYENQDIAPREPE